MPNYGLSINSTFTPFTMQELLTPVMSATNSLREIEDAYGKQQSEADQLEYIANLLEQEGSEASLAAAQKYRNYQDVVRQSAEELMSTGNISKGRRALWNSTRQYATDVLPMKIGYEQLAADIKTQASTPGIAYKHRVTYSDLPSYIADPMGVSLQQGTVDLNNIAKMSSELFSTYQKALRLGKGSKAWDNMTNILEKQHGLTVEQAERFLDDHNLDSALSKMYNLALDMTGADESWSDFNKIKDIIDISLWNAVGNREATLEKDNEAIARAKSILSSKKSSSTGSELSPLPARDLFVVERNAFVDNNSEFFNKDNTGKLSINKKNVLKLLEQYDHIIDNLSPEQIEKLENFDENLFTTGDKYNDILNALGTAPGDNPETAIFWQVKTYKDLYKKAKDMMEYLNIPENYREVKPVTSVWKDITGRPLETTLKPTMQYTIDFDKINELINESPEKAETLLHRQAEYYYQPKGSDNDDIINALMNSLPDDGKFTVVNRKSNKDYTISYKDTGETFKKGKLRDYNITEVAFSDAGYVVRIQNKKDNDDTKTIRIPKGRLTDNLDTIFRNLKTQRDKFGKIKEDNPNKETQKTLINQLYQKSESDMGDLFSNWYRPNTAPALKRNYNGIKDLSIEQLMQLAEENNMSLDEVIDNLTQ